MKDIDSGTEYVEDEDFSGEQSVQEKIKTLRTKLKECESEKRSNLEGWQRSKADLTNYKKEVAEQRSQFNTLGAQSVIVDLLPMVDAFFAAMKNKDSWESVDSKWRTGVEYIHNQLLKVFDDYGAQLVIPNSGDVFDESIHELSGGDNSEGDKVDEVIRPGLVIADKTIRNAIVKIRT